MTRLVSALVAFAVSLLLAACATSGAVRCEILPDGLWSCSVDGQGDTGAPGM